MSSDIPLPTPFSVTSSPHPHDQAGAGRQRDDEEDRGDDTRVRDDRQLAVGQQLAGTGQRHQGRGIQEAQGDGEVTRVLRQLRLAGRAFLIEHLEAGNDHPEQLHDDTRRDVRHDPEREDRDLQQCTAAEQVDELIDAARGLTGLQALLDILVVHTRRGDESTQAEDCDDSQREQQLASQIRRAKGPAECAKQASS
ncbi:hypothetical protein QFZ79_002267 [Arthrobacter sp. V4I6]|nr:hypothetical protein [Arthrobacter sp. V4I6]